MMNINSLIGLFDERNQTYGFKFLLTNRLNQDPLENHFAIIRGLAGFRDNPNPKAFKASFRQVLAMPRNTNCADDLASFMLSIRDVEHGTVRVAIAGT